MSLRVILSLTVLAACQSSDADTSARPTPVRAPGVIEVRDASGAVTARVTPGFPCRATIDNVELQIGTLPLVTQVGATRWSGKVAPNGTTLSRDDAPVARMYSASRTELALFDLEGAPLMRANVTGDTASIGDRGGSIVRTIARKGTDLIITSSAGGATPSLTVTGTTDLLLAALLTASETSPEVRGLAACHRLFPIEARPEAFGP